MTDKSGLGGISPLETCESVTTIEDSHGPGRASGFFNGVFQKMRVLIADDNSTTADVVRFNLERQNINVVVAHDGAQALLFFQAQDFDCVVVDHTMPGMKGNELCGRIREHDPKVPIVLLTGRTLEPSVMELYSSFNIAKAIPKPFSPRELVSTVTELISENADGESPAEAN